MASPPSPPAPLHDADCEQHHKTRVAAAVADNELVDAAEQQQHQAPTKLEKNTHTTTTTTTVSTNKIKLDTESSPSSSQHATALLRSRSSSGGNNNADDWKADATTTTTSVVESTSTTTPCVVEQTQQPQLLSIPSLLNEKNDSSSTTAASDGGVVVLGGGIIPETILDELSNSRIPPTTQKDRENNNELDTDNVCISTTTPLSASSSSSLIPRIVDKRDSSSPSSDHEQRTRQQENDDDDEAAESSDSSSSSSDEEEDESLLSEPEYRDYWKDLQEPKPVFHTLEEKWNDLERQFRKRDRLLCRISKTKSPKFVMQMRERELLVKVQTFEELLAAASGADDSLLDPEQKLMYQNKIRDEKSSFYKDHPTTTTSKRRSFVRRCRDAWVFEMNSSFPAIFSLMVHSIAHSGIYDGLNNLFDWIQKKIYTNNSSSEGSRNEFHFYGSIYFIGIVMLRLTGDLYWWLSDSDYDCLKFDLHNRHRLGFLDARVLSWVRVREVLRVILYMVGYHCCYAAVGVLLSSIQQRFFDDREFVMDSLPSVVFEEDFGTCLAEREESYCSTSCQEEMELQEKEYLFFKQADMNYTWNVLSLDSYEDFWYNWMHQSDEEEGTDTSPYFRNDHHAVYCFASCVMSIVLLRIYGFKIWMKY